MPRLKIWNEAENAWDYVGVSVTPDALDDLLDVNASSPKDGEVLTWDEGTEFWIPASGSSMEEAPEDDLFYARRNADWQEVVNTNTGFENRTDSTINLATRTITVSGEFNIYSNGIKFTKTGGATCQTTIPNTVGIHYVYFDTDGELQNSTDTWDITGAGVPVCSVYWNGSAGALSEERHSYKRNQQWHLWAHDTIGTRYETGLEQVYPTTANDGYTEINAGIIFDEDLEIDISTTKLVRLWYETAAGTWTWANGTDNGGYDRPYIWNAGTSRLQYPKSNSAYALTDCDSNKYLVSFVYATTDVDRPIYVVIKSKTAPYNNLTEARAAAFPSLSGFLTPEMKVIYKWIFSGDGQYQEGVDYRTTAPLPSGGSTIMAATSVTFAATGNISSTNVQNAIAELDTEKVSKAGDTMTGSLDIDGDIEATGVGPVLSGIISSIGGGSATCEIPYVSDSAPGSPIDGELWWDTDDTTPLVNSHFHTLSDIDSEVSLSGQIVFSDGNGGAFWDTLNAEVEEAPIDGTAYNRQDAGWVSAGSASVPPALKITLVLSYR